MLSPAFLNNIALALLVASTSVMASGPAPVGLGTAANYVILAKSGVSTVPSSSITGNVGLSPAASTSITGFSLTKHPNGTSSTSTQVMGSIFAPDYTSPTPSNLVTAIENMEAAFTDASGRANPASTDHSAGLIGGMTFQPGLYKWTSGVGISKDITISGNAEDTWIFQIAGTLTTDSSVKIILEGGAQAHNIVWAVSGTVSVGTSGHFEGIILAATDVTLTTGASMNGRVFAQTAVNLQKVTLVQPSN